jgi:hypothetical protein
MRQSQVRENIADLRLREEIDVGPHAEWQFRAAQAQCNGSRLHVGAIQDAYLTGVFDLAGVQ